MKQLLIATRNRGKLPEMEALLAAALPGVELLCLADAGIAAEAPETAPTFAGNAREKALFYSRLTPLPVLGDDSGLEVAALDGRPGVHSARYAGPQADDAARVAKLLAEMAGHDNRRARFVSAVCLAQSGRVLAECDGTVEGVILTAPRGVNGFGYDPVFYYPPLRRTFAELDRAEKNSVSHRAAALRQLAQLLAGLSGRLHIPTP